MRKCKCMDQVKNIQLSYQVTQSIKATARQLKISKNTVRDYLRRCRCYSEDLSSVLSLDDESFAKVIYPTETARSTSSPIPGCSLCTSIFRSKSSNPAWI
jgi:hypothetical protein